MQYNYNFSNLLEKKMDEQPCTKEQATSDREEISKKDKGIN